MDGAGVEDAGAGFDRPALVPPKETPVRRAIGARHRKREEDMSINEITQLITAVAGLVLAIAKLVRVWRQPP